MLSMRIAGLIARLHALDTRIAINKGELPSFDDEAMALFGSDRAALRRQRISNRSLKNSMHCCPAKDPLAKRVEAFNNQFAIPLDKLPAVFEAAMD